LSTKILLLEDDKLFNETLQDFLEEEGFVVECVLDPYSALDKTYETSYDLYLFDINLPYETGLELLKKLRDASDDTPTIFITSRKDKASLLEGFNHGGDDYLSKPVDLDELLVRIYALLRRQVRDEKIEIGGYHFDTLNKILYKEESTVELTPKAAALLYLLLEAKGQIVLTEQIKSTLWTASEASSDGALRVYITQLKKYFPQQIENIRGVGYKMEISRG